MDTICPLEPTGCFQWNAGAWFGSQLGGSAWMLVGSATMTPGSPILAGAWLACFATANGVGLWLWRRRDRVRPYPAIQALLLTLGVCGVAAWLALWALGTGARAAVGSPRQGIFAMGIVPLLMAWFALMEHHGRRVRESRRHAGG